MTFDPGRPFNDLPDLPPASETETKTILRGCIAARAALAELRVSGNLIPNQAMLINSIPLLEAQASSEIENIVTTTDWLFRYANDAAGRADPATREALRYRTALHRGFEMLEQRPVSTEKRLGAATRGWSSSSRRRSCTPGGWARIWIRMRIRTPCSCPSCHAT